MMRKSIDGVTSKLKGLVTKKVENDRFKGSNNLFESITKPSEQNPSPLPNPTKVRLLKLAFPFAMAYCFIVPGYIFMKVKERDGYVFIKDKTRDAATKEEGFNNARNNSVLGLEGLPSVSPSSSLSIEVSVGKQVYEIQDKGDFFFPLSNLRDKMILKIHNDEGNEIAHTGIQTRLIAERGFWDDLFALEGGGYVHMRLQFILSEEERNKIRIMRESALRKKQEELLNKSQNNSEDSQKNTGAMNERSADVKAIKLLNESVTKILNKEQAAPSYTGRRNEETTSAADVFCQKDHSFRISQEASSHSAGNLRSRAEVTAAKVGTQHDDPGRLDALEKMPSNVRKMILAFESSSTQEYELDVGQIMRKSHLGSGLSEGPDSEIPATTMSTKRVEHKLGRQHSPAISQGTYAGRGQDNSGTCGTSNKDQYSLTTEHLIKLNSKSHDENSNEKNEFISVNRSEVFLEDKKSSKELLHRPSTSETKTVLEKVLHMFPYSSQWPDQLAKQQYPSNKGMPRESEGGFCAELSQHSECPEVSYMTERFYSDSFGGWMFLNEAVCSCMATDSKPWLYQFVQCSSDLMSSEIQQGKRKGGNNSRTWKNSVSNNSPKGGVPKGPPGKAVKIALMIGFGILVLFTRQRQPR